VDPTGRFPRVSAARPTTADDGGGGGGWLVRASAVERGGVTVGGSTSTRRTARGFWRSREENCQATRARERDLQRIYRERDRTYRGYVSTRTIPMVHLASPITTTRRAHPALCPRMGSATSFVYADIAGLCACSALEGRKRKLSAKDPVLFFPFVSNLSPAKGSKATSRLRRPANPSAGVHTWTRTNIRLRAKPRARARTYHTRARRVSYVCVCTCSLGAANCHQRCQFTADRRSSRRTSV